MENVQRVKKVASIIYGDEVCLEEALIKLKDTFGSVGPLVFDADFDYTDYYYDELGPSLKRRIVVFKELADIENIFKLKLVSIEIERSMSFSGNRRVNIDPGYVTEAKLILFTTKNYSHRIYLGEGIFAECTLFFSNGDFNPWPWTYPDYASRGMRDFFLEVRKEYMEKLKDDRAVRAGRSLAG